MQVPCTLLLFICFQIETIFVIHTKRFCLYILFFERRGTGFSSVAFDYSPLTAFLLGLPGHYCFLTCALLSIGTPKGAYSKEALSQAQYSICLGMTYTVLAYTFVPTVSRGSCRR